jgi:uracil-DNA glycosylase
VSDSKQSLAHTDRNKGQTMTKSFDQLLADVRACTLCTEQLPLGPRPVLQVGANASILIVGQAPGVRVHETGVPFDDPSGERLREWMGVDRNTFYNPELVAILPMGFCYPGKGKSGDLPPRPECADKWRAQLLGELGAVKLTLVIGQYAMKWHLADAPKGVTATVKAWKTFDASVLPLPHPSPRNNIWLKKNPWFEKEVLPELRRRVKAAL